MAGKVRKEEMRVFVEPWVAERVRAEVGFLGMTESEVVRTILLDWARLGFRKMPLSYFLLKPNVQTHEVCTNARSRLCASCRENCELAGKRWRS
jgi:antitoxin component of RelBE/YafQ-DinJ toxin-antitoxin module